jgi:NADH:ubiquinone oxidoreductase subunit H
VEVDAGDFQIKSDNSKNLQQTFDFAEGESELVSGFNIEYGAVGFAILFIAEYARIFFIS